MGKPNPKYNQNLDPSGYHNYKIDKAQLSGKPNPIGFDTKGQKLYEDPEEILKRVSGYEQNTPLDRLWNKFGTHMEDGKKYHHYKNPEDYFSAKTGSNQHGLFGGYSKKTSKKREFDYKTGMRYSWKRPKEDYYDNWDFSRNRSVKDIANERLEAGATKFDTYKILAQRSLAEALLKPLEFKGTAKNIYRKSTKQQSDAADTVRDYFNTISP